MYYDRNGEPVSITAWSRLVEDMQYTRIARTTVASAADPAIAYHVSTIWLGLDHGFGWGRKLIFETAVFGGDGRDMGCDARYDTEQAARDGHANTVTVVAATVTDPVVVDMTEPDESEGP